MQRALAIDGNDNWARLVLGWAFLRLHQFDEAEEQFDRALALNPNDAEVMAWMAQALVFLGRAEEASELIQQAMRLNPLHPNSYYMILANAAYFTGRYDDALRGFRQGSEHGVWHHANMAATYAQLGRIEDARTHAAMFVGTRRKQYEASGNPIPNDDLSLAAERVLRMKREIDRDRYIDGLRKAGLSD